jgi:cardiolipin synthase
LETYIFNGGEIAHRFTAALEAAARRGVDVRLVLDSVGAKMMDSEHVKRLTDAGCRIVWFNQVSGFELQELNYRTHRKSLVVDGTVGFIGGIGIADAWDRDTATGPAWRDTQIEVRGPAAVYIEGSFNENWIESGEVVEPTVNPFDAAAQGGAQSVVVWSSPESGANGMKLLYLLAIGSARKSLDIESPYLITDSSTEWSLEDARRRGVHVRLLVEGDITDAKPVKFASRAAYERLLEHGIEIYEYQPAMLHAKVMVVDDVLAVIGSANFDNRSLELNDELSVAVFDPHLAARLLTDMERDITRSRKLDLANWRARPLHIRARDQFWSFFGEVF